MMRSAPAVAAVDAVPRYLRQVYWWAYVHPRAVRLFERPWLVNAILFGHYARLRDAALQALGTPGAPLDGHTLQVACVYGNLTPLLRQRLGADAQLQVLDALPIQLSNLRHKLPADPRVQLLLADAAALPQPDASVDRVLMFFLLHEMPDSVRRDALAQALRVLKPGGRLVLVDYHRPVPWHPLRPLMRLVFNRLEPYAMDLWQHELDDFMPAGVAVTTLQRRTWFGGLYQLRVLQR